jgi:hypothetical protein
VDLESVSRAAASWPVTAMICAPACNQLAMPFCYLFCKFIVIMPLSYPKKEGLIVFDENRQSFSNKFSPGDEIMKTPQ